MSFVNVCPLWTTIYIRKCLFVFYIKLLSMFRLRLIWLPHERATKNNLWPLCIEQVEYKVFRKFTEAVCDILIFGNMERGFAYIITNFCNPAAK